MKNPNNLIIPTENVEEKARSAGSIEELMAYAKNVLTRSVAHRDYVLNIPDAITFLDEARRRCEQVTDDAERKKYEAMIAEVDAMVEKELKEVMGERWQEE